MQRVEGILVLYGAIVQVTATGLRPCRLLDCSHQIAPTPSAPSLHVLGRLRMLSIHLGWTKLGTGWLGS